MHYLKIDNLKPGVILGKALIHRDGRILLHKGTPLSQAYIDRIRLNEIEGVYIETEFSKDIIIEEAISEELRNDVVNNIKHVFNRLKVNQVKAIARRMSDIKQMMNEIIDQVFSAKDTVTNVIDMKNFDEYTYQHSVNVAVISTILGVAYGNLSQQDLLNLGMGAIFHDLGKIFVPLEILNKPGKLTPEEFAEIKKHPSSGYDFIKKSNLHLSNPTCAAVLQHHEKYNGEGYPNGYTKGNIYKFARIIAVADVYDAITSIRPYNKPMLPSEAFEYIIANSGIHFDPEVVRIFATKIAPYQQGDIVHLSNGRRGIVVKNYSDYPLRPRIKLFPLGVNEENRDYEYLDLRNDKESMNITITGTDIMN